MLRAKYQPDPLRAALTSVFWGPRLRDSTKRLVVTSYNLGADGFWLFRTADHSRLRRDWRERAVDAAMATSAAPTICQGSRWRAPG